jgi:hypothetical protein
MVDRGTGGGLASLVEDSAAAKVGSTFSRGSVTIFHVKNPYQSICPIDLDGDGGDIVNTKDLN